MSMLTVTRADMSFCPGCSHGLVLEHLEAALRRLGREPHGVCLVSDIGCVGIADRYFACHTFHGLHGRSITYAEGIKRTRPDLLVVVVIGDGGCGIGTAHLVHAARRRAGITVLVCNNFNFGMTGGQQSPTTPACAKTTTSPGGATDHPFDICATVAANGASFVARQSALDAGCVDLIETALRTPGFALVDLWELCVAYYVPANKLTPPDLVRLSQRLNMPFGVLREVAHDDGQHGHVLDTPPRAKLARRDAAVRSADGSVSRMDHATPDLSHPGQTAEQAPRRSASLSADPTLRQAKPEAARVLESPVPPIPWSGRKEICVAGSAGQRVQAAAGVLGELCLQGGCFAAQQNDFPITVRRGHSVSNLILAEGPIRYTGLDRPDLVVLLSGDGLARLRADGVPLDQARVWAPVDLVGSSGAVGSAPVVSTALVSFDLKRTEKHVGKASAALAVLTAAVVEAGWMDPGWLVEAAERVLQGPHRDDQLRAIRYGCERPFAALATPSGGAASTGQLCRTGDGRHGS